MSGEDNPEYRIFEDTAHRLKMLNLLIMEAETICAELRILLRRIKHGPPTH